MKSFIKTIQPYGIWIALAITIITAGCIAIVSFSYNDFFLTTADMGGLACGSNHLAETGTFSNGQTGGIAYNFNICWTKDSYPGLQFLHAVILKIVPIEAWQLIIITSALAYMTTAVLAMWLIWMIRHSSVLAIMGGLLTASSPALLRSMLLTPQNAHGYAWILLILVIIVWLIKNKYNKWWLLLVLVPALLLVVIHTLSFGIIMVTLAIWIWLFVIKKWRWRLALLAVGILGAFGNEVIQIIPFSINEAYQLLKSSFGGYNKPLWDHPSIWGYIITSLGALGLLLYREMDRSIKWLLGILLFIPVIFAHLSVIGIILLPSRFAAFGWIGLTLLAPFGIAVLWQRLNLKDWMVAALCITIIVGSISHALVFTRDDVDGWSARFKPRDGFSDALTWLNEYDSEGTLLGIMAVTNREITFAPIWYDGIVTSYPWYNLNHKKLKKFEANSGLYQSVFANPESAEYKRVSAFHSIITDPNNNDVPQYIKEYGLDYYIVPRGSQGFKIWNKLANDNKLDYPVLYNSDSHIIYGLQ